MKYLLIMIVALGLNACKQQTEQLPESKTIAVVGESVITQDMLKAFLRANGISSPNDETTKRAFEALINEVVLADKAKEQKLKLNPEQLNTLHYLRIKALANSAKEDYLKKHPITEEAIKAEYAKGSKKAGNFEYRIHHLLYKDEVEAIKQREKINSVADYLALEKTYLQQRPQANKIGDLGWVSLGQLPKEFQATLNNVPENTILKKVINSQFGAHIVYLQEKRALQPPPLDKVKAGITRALEAKQISKLTQVARAKAHIKVKE